MKASNGEEVSIEKDYQFLCLCNDFIVDVLKSADYYKWSEERIKLKEKDIKKAQSTKYDLIYFRNHGYAKQINKSLYRHLFFSLISDYNINFHDSFECAYHYHYGPAFTLLRKPFKDNLLLIEMMYIRGHLFIKDFLNNSISDFAIDKISPEKKKEVLKKCTKRVGLSNQNEMYNLRYDKNSFETLEKIWNKTMHIITTAKSYATSDNNLNVIFSSKETVEQNLVYYFKVTRYIQLYFISLVLNILKKENLISEKSFQENLNMILFAYSCILEENNDNLLLSYSGKCPYCLTRYTIYKEDTEEDYLNKFYNYKCKKCRRKFRVSRFSLQKENINE